MASNNKVQMPSSGGGLVRYFDDIKTGIPIKPEYVIIAIVAVFVLEIILHRTGFLG